MYPKKWLALMTTLCLLAGLLPGALAEEQDVAVGLIDEQIAPAETAGEDTGLTVEGEAEQLFQLEEELIQELPTGADDSFAVEAPTSGMGYARIVANGTPVYYDTVTADLIAKLAAGEVVLVTGAGAELLPVAFNAGGIAEGYVSAGSLAPLDEAEARAYQDAAAASGEVALYAEDLDWPLARLGDASAASTQSVMASANYKDLGNDTRYTINGKEIYANMFPDTGSGQCWAWAQKVYSHLWGCRFGSDFEGSAATGMNLLRKLTDSDRLLTPEHLKTFVMSAQPGATIRVSSCTSDCSQWANDGLSCGHKGHSLIIVDKNAEGVFTMDSHSNSQHTRFYSWQGFCNSWKNYDHVKYIKWPNAPALPPVETVDGISVRSFEAKYRVRATATAGVGLYSLPGEGALLATLVYPTAFDVAKKSTGEIAGSEWLYVRANGVVGWVALNGAVADVNERIPVTDVSLSQAKVLVVEGATATLSAAVAPIDATDQGVTWTSADPAVAAVANGVITGIAAGTTTITATTADGGKTAACEVMVSKPIADKTLSKTGSNGTVKLAPGQQLRLVPKFATSKGWKVKSASSSKPKCVAVDKSGVLTAKAEGKATITVVTKNKKKATLTVQVTDPTKATKVVLNKNGTVKMKKGAKARLSALVYPSTAVTTLTWKSSKPNVVSVDTDGNVVALKKGTSYVAVKTANGKIAKVKIKVV